MALFEQDQKQFDRSKHLIIGAVLGAALLAGIGTLWPGWNLESTTKKRIAIAQHSAVIMALGPGCAEKFRALPDAVTLTAAMKAARSWERKDVFIKDGDRRLIQLVTVPGDSNPDEHLADYCAELIAPSAGAGTN